MNYHYPKYYIDHNAPCVTLHVSRMDDAFPEIAISMDARLLKSLQELEQRCHVLQNYFPEIRLSYGVSMTTYPISIRVPSHEGVLDITESCDFQHWSYCLTTYDATTSVVWKDAWVTMCLDDQPSPKGTKYKLYLTMIDPEGRECVMLLGPLAAFSENAEKAIRHVHDLSRS